MARRGRAALALGVLPVALAACGESATARPEARATASASAAASGAAEPATVKAKADPKGEDSGW